LKIFFLSLGGTYPFRIGGPSVIAYNLIREFDKKGIKVDFAFGISREHLRKNFHLYNLFGFSKNIQLIPIIKNERSPTSYKTPKDCIFFKDVNILSKKVEKKYDLIHFQNIPNTKDIFIPFLAWIKRIPSVYRASGWLTYEALNKVPGKHGLYYDFFTYKILNKFFTKIVCNSFFLKQKTIIDGIREEKIEIIPNGVNVEKFRNARRIKLSGDPALLFVGRLAYNKGIDILIKSMKMIAKELPEAVLHVVGDGHLMNQLKSFVVRNNLEKRVIFHGQIIESLPSFYVSSDICVFPSVYETFGLTIIEAMAAGKPLIATNKGGVPENVKNFENGFLIEPTMRNVIRTIINLWNDKNLMSKISKNNLEKAKNYDWPKIAERYLMLYNQIFARTEYSYVPAKY